MGLNQNTLDQVGRQMKAMHSQGPSPREYNVYLLHIHDSTMHPQPHVCTMNHIRNGQTQTTKCMGHQHWRLSFYTHPAYLGEHISAKNQSAFLPFYLCCTLQGEVGALCLPAASLHF